MAVISIYDSVNEGRTTGIPRSAQIIAFYADGRYANEAAARATFPGREFISITVFGLPGCRVCDCETGDLTPAEEAKWCHDEIVAGRRPTGYHNLSTHPAAVAEMAKYGLEFGRDADWWAADYVNFPYLVPGSVATQWGGNLAGNYDISDTNGIWPGTIAAPIPTGGSMIVINGIDFDLTPTGNGIWELQNDGAIFTHGDAQYLGGLNTTAGHAAAVGIASHPTAEGYWIASADGGVFTYGAVNFFGSMGGTALAKPIVKIRASRSGNGYALEGADGGIFAFGDFDFTGSGG